MNHVPPASFSAHIKNHSKTCPVARTLVRFRRFGSTALFGRQRTPLPENAKPRDVATAMPANDTSPPSSHPL